MEKLFFIILFALILTNCSTEADVSTVEIKNNSDACIENLQADTYIRACDDIVKEINIYTDLQKVDEVDIDFDFFDKILTDLKVVADVSNDKNIINATKKLHNNIYDSTKSFLNDNKHSDYHVVDDISKFKQLANSFVSETSLQYQHTNKKRIAYDSDDYIYKTRFIDDNNIVIDYYTDQNGIINAIHIESLTNNKSVYYNFAKIYSQYILSKQYLNPINTTNYNSLLIEKKLQFPVDENFREDNNVEISIIDDTVVFKSLN